AIPHSQLPNRSGSRSRDNPRYARSRASWTTSSTSSSGSIRPTTASTLRRFAPTSAANAAGSPRRAALTRSRSLPTPSLLRERPARLRRAEAATSRRLDRDDVAGGQVARRLGRQRGAVEEVPARCGLVSSAFAPRCVRAALADDGEAAVLENAQLAHDSVTAATSPRPTR